MNRKKPFSTRTDRILCGALPAGSISLFPINSPISLFPIGFDLFVFFFFFKQCTHVSLCAHSGGGFCLQKKQKNKNKTFALPYRFLHFSKISKPKKKGICDFRQYKYNKTHYKKKNVNKKQKRSLLEKGAGKQSHEAWPIHAGAGDTGRGGSFQKANTCYWLKCWFVIKQDGYKMSLCAVKNTYSHATICFQHDSLFFGGFVRSMQLEEEPIEHVLGFFLESSS